MNDTQKLELSELEDVNGGNYVAAVVGGYLLAKAVDDYVDYAAGEMAYGVGYLAGRLGL